MTTLDPRARLFPPLVPIVWILAGIGLQLWRPLRLVSPPAGRWIGGGLILLWLVLAAWALGMFRRVGTTPDPMGEVTVFVTDGPFRFTRNPMYLGLLLFQAGAAFLLSNGWVLLFVPLSFLLLDRVVIAGEEGYLAARYGAAYDEYRHRVRRWL
jgi:protein-S-isoprenylcysteine O-methyltransferase Ste14